MGKSKNKLFKKKKDEIIPENIEGTESTEIAELPETDEKPKKTMSKPMRITIAILIAIAVIVIGVLAYLLISEALAPQSGIEAFFEPGSVESEFAAALLDGEGFSAELTDADNTPVFSAEFDGRTGDFASTISGDKVDSAVYLRDSILTYKKNNSSLYYSCDTDAKPGKLPVSLSDRAEGLWEKYEKQSGQKNMLKPYKKIIKSYRKSFVKTNGDTKMYLLGKDRTVTAYYYKLSPEQSAQLLNDLLEQFQTGDALYDFVNEFYEEQDIAFFEGYESIEDFLDKVESIRSSLLSEDGGIEFIQYKKGGLFGIGRHIIAESCSLNLSGDSPMSLLMYAKGYNKGTQTDKQLTVTYTENWSVKNEFDFTYTAIKKKGQLNITGVLTDSLIENGVEVDYSGTSNKSGDIVCTTIDADITAADGNTKACKIDSEVSETQLKAVIDYNGGNYNFNLENGTGNPVFPDFGSLNVSEKPFGEIFKAQ